MAHDTNRSDFIRPMNMFSDTSYQMIAYDLFNAKGPLHRFYGWEPVRKVIAKILGLETLYLNDNTYQPANVIVYRDGDHLTWHFDRGNEFTVTLMLQDAEPGGEFEIAPEIWHHNDTNPTPLPKVITKEGGDPVHMAPRSPASLVIFRGDRRVDRVSEVKGVHLRMMAVMVYKEKPGVIGRPEVNETVYGPRIALAAE